MRRNAKKSRKDERENGKVIESGGLKLDTDSRRVFIADKEINLTAKRCV